MRRSIALSVVSLLLLGTAACGDDSGGTTESADDAIKGVTVEGEVGKEIKVEMDAPIAKSTKSEVITEGDGTTLEAGNFSLLHLYIGNATSGKDAISTYDEGYPIQVQASEDQLFKQVLDGPSGDKVEPPADAPKVVEKDGNVTGIDWSDAPKKAPKKLTVIPLVEGDGPVAQAGTMVTFDYYGAVWGKDKPFDESYSREPSPFGVGVGGLIPAWDENIPGLKRGSRVLIIAPAKDAYGDREQPNIPAGSTLAFVVDVLGVDE